MFVGTNRNTSQNIFIIFTGHIYLKSVNEEERGAFLNVCASEKKFILKDRKFFSILFRVTCPSSENPPYRLETSKLSKQTNYTLDKDRVPI